MATNHWKIIIDNFPKYFSEKVTFLYGFETTYRAIAHMRGVWAHEHGVKVTATSALHLHGDVESQIKVPVEVASATLTTYAKFPNEYQVQVDTIPRLHCYGKFPTEYKVPMEVVASTKVNCRYESEMKVQVDVVPRLKLKGKANLESAVQMNVLTPVTNLHGRFESQYKVPVSAEGYLETRGRVTSEYAVQMRAVAMVAIFYKLFERNDETLETVNELTLNDFCIKTIS